MSYAKISASKIKCFLCLCGAWFCEYKRGKYKSTKREDCVYGGPANKKTPKARLRDRSRGHDTGFQVRLAPGFMPVPCTCVPLGFPWHEAPDRWERCSAMLSCPSLHPRCTPLLPAPLLPASQTPIPAVKVPPRRRGPGCAAWPGRRRAALGAGVLCFISPRFHQGDGINGKGPHGPRLRSAERGTGQIPSLLSDILL